MKLKQRVVLVLLVACAILAVLSLVYYLSFEMDYEEPSISKFHRHIPSRSLPHVKRFLKNHSEPYKEHNGTEYPVIDSNRAAEVQPVSEETLPLKYVGLKRPKKVRGMRTTARINCQDKTVLNDDTQKGDYADLTRLLDMWPDTNNGGDIFEDTIQDFLGITPDANLTNMEKFYLKISSKEMYKSDEPLVEKILHDMATLPIVKVDEKEGGTQLKLLITFSDGSQAIFKPMRFSRKKETEPNHFYFVDFERHVSEIAAFHLDRVLGFRRAPPVVGRLLNITSEIYAFADDELLKTFFISPANNICFHGRCSYYCDTAHAICGRPDMLEGSLAMMLPPDSLTPRKAWRNPWRRSYHKRRRAEWEVNDSYCDSVRFIPPYRSPERLAAVVDMSILDFLIGNMDRHHYETFKLFGNKSFIVHLDHGRGFGRSSFDEVSILAPLYQCCFLSFSTFRRLLEIYNGPRNLSDIMRCSLQKDPLDPILMEKHLLALDRRLVTVLEVIRDCLTRNSAAELLYRP